MKTLKLDITKKNIELAGNIVKTGGLVAFPTETVYGLGANAMDEVAVGKIYKAKGRPSDNPMIIHIAKMEQLQLLCESFSETAKILMDIFWPGPITFVLKKKSSVPDITTGLLDTVAVRMPSDEIAVKLINSAGLPIAAPSANLSGSPSPTKAEDVLEDMMGRIDAVLMGGTCPVGIESTVVDVTKEVPVILRPGYITKEDIDKVVNIKAVFDESVFQNPKEPGFKPKSPGMKYKHYSPKADLKIVRGQDENLDKTIEILKEKYSNQGKSVGIIYYGDDNEKAARNFFSDLRKLDRENMDIIITSALKPKGLGFSVMNRMLKSAGYEVIDAEEVLNDCDS
ncbi:MAG TPA: L-threonylcarbamoyladenylate synthase [Anaerovoracaceae bacterium]|nr:L-threonylcarbamoyladenylate synthase [Anaerovoracaceae bacterium]